MKRLVLSATALALCGAFLLSVVAQDKPAASSPGGAASPVAQAAAAPAAPAASAPAEVVCFESRKGATELTQKEIRPGVPNVKCSPVTGAALWYGDP